MDKYLIFGAVLALAGCRGGGGLTSYVPSDTVALVGVEMGALKATPVYRKLETRGWLKLDELAGRSGIDPRKDVSELLIASNGKDAVVIGRGRFQLKESLPAGYKVEKPEPDIAVAGPERAVRAALDQHRNGGGAAIVKRAQTLRGQNQIWIVATDAGALADQFAPREGNAANLRPLARGIGETTLLVDLRTGLRAAATAACADSGSARKLADAMRGLAGMSRLAVPNNQPELLKLYDGIQVTDVGTTVTIEITWPEALIDKLLALAPKLRN